MATGLANALWYGLVVAGVAIMLLLVWRNVPKAGAKWWSVSLGALFLHRLWFPSEDIPWVVLLLSLVCFFKGLWVM